jgi:hypothetical protein
MALLMRQELDLFKAEITEKAKSAGKSAGEGASLLGGAALCGLMAAASLTALVILLLALVMPAWVAVLIVTALYGVAAIALGIAGKYKLGAVAPPVPMQTIETVKEDVEWAKTRANSVKK